MNMLLTTEQKRDIVKKYGVNENDTGSVEVQVALLTARIKALTDHCKDAKQDRHSRRGLLRLVNMRRRLLTYIKAKSITRYRSLIASLGLRS